MPLKLSNALVDEVVREIAGEDVIPLTNYLKKRKNVSEFKLVDELGIEINLVRNMLYRLYHHNLVSFTRRKDKKKGWYIYYWTFKLKEIKHVALTMYRQKLEKLNDRIARESNSQFFICANTCMRLDFETAIGFEFKCPECGELMEQQSNQKKIKELQGQVKTIEKLIT